MDVGVMAFKKLNGRVGLAMGFTAAAGLTWLFCAMARPDHQSLMGGVGLGMFAALVIQLIFCGGVERPRHDDESSWSWTIERYVAKEHRVEQQRAAAERRALAET
ncbi:MAG: hypothetical protein HY461_02900 [Parcubacteria group bacterium]|nr:hypothetical protein [Parcubacteria group bacterium]